MQKALDKFIKCNEDMENALKELRDALKTESSQIIQRHIGNEEFDKANQIINKLNEFTKVDFKSNAGEIKTFAENIFNIQEKSYLDTPQINIISEKQIEEIDAEEEIDEIKKFEALSHQEQEIVENIGYSGISRLKDFNVVIEQTDILSLEKKGILKAEEIKYGKEKLLTFELTEEGRKYFEDICGIEANESLKSELKKKHKTIEKGFFLYDLENALQNRNIEIHSLGENQVEISEDGKHCYLTPDIGNFTKSDYLRILNQKKQLLNIGFICANNEILNKAKTIVQEWFEGNEQKSKLLTIQLTNIGNIEEKARFFETLKLV